jgi:nucleoside-diphosphate-sugar epimerase
MTRVLVTGANGFVGRHLCAALARAGHQVTAALRGPGAANVTIANVSVAVVGDIHGGTDWSEALRDIDVVIHTAARVHNLGDSAANAQRYFDTNTSGTARLAEASAAARVRRLVFLSSVKVNGERTNDVAFGAGDSPRPVDAYGISKWQGEQALISVAARSALQTVIVRTPLVYGPEVRANFLRLMGWIHARRPLPFGRIDNRRSLTSIGNLCDLLLNTIYNPAAANRTFMVSDDFDLSTRELTLKLAAAMGVEAQMLPVPVGLLRLAGRMMGRAAEVGRLCDSLTVDCATTRVELGWTPPLTVEVALAETARWFLGEGRVRVA